MIVDNHDQEALKIGETLRADSIVGEGAAPMSTKGIDQGKQDQGQEEMSTGGS